jgi:hypothetical protein
MFDVRQFGQMPQQANLERPIGMDGTDNRTTLPDLP